MIVFRELGAASLWYYRQVLGNVLATLPCFMLGALGAWLFRDRIGRRLAAFAHKHYEAHKKRITAEAEEHDNSVH